MLIKYILIVTLLFNIGCSTKESIETTTLNIQRTKSCQNEINRVIRELVNAQNLKISDTIFTKEPYLYLTNRVINDFGGRKTLLLYKKDNSLYIALLDFKKEIKKDTKLIHCK